MIDRFREILNELSPLLHTSLYPDRRGACKIKFNNLLEVQIEFQPEKNRLLMASFICEVAPGKFRENVFKDALKINCPMPSHGTLSYCEKNNQLCLFQYIYLEYITGQKIFDLLQSFVQKGNTWRTAVASGHTATLVPFTPVK